MLPKKKRNIKRIKTSFIKIEHYNISKLLDDSALSKFWEKMDWSNFCFVVKLIYQVDNIILAKI